MLPRVSWTRVCDASSRETPRAVAVCGWVLSPPYRPSQPSGLVVDNFISALFDTTNARSLTYQKDEESVFVSNHNLGTIPCSSPGSRVNTPSAARYLAVRMTFTGAPISSRAAALRVSRATSAIQRSDRKGGVEHVVPFFAFAPSIRKMIYTTNAVEALHRSLREIIKTRGSFPER
jgi:hypothetical protein